MHLSVRGLLTCLICTFRKMLVFTDLFLEIAYKDGENPIFTATSSLTGLCTVVHGGEERRPGGEDAVIRFHPRSVTDSGFEHEVITKRSDITQLSPRPARAVQDDDGVPVHAASCAGVPYGERREGPTDGADRSFPISLGGK